MSDSDTETARRDLLGRAARIRLVVLDVDGVLTDGRLHFSSNGEETKTFHTRDGAGVKQLRRAGVEVAVISGRASDAVTRRMGELGVVHVFQGIGDKMPVLNELLERLDLAADQVAYMGDDTPDVAVMRAAGLAVCPADAHASAAAASHWQTTRPGGRGAVRELCDLIVEARAGGDEFA